MTTAQRLADAVQRAATRTIVQEAAGWRMATVTATYTDGTVDITTAHGPVARVRRLKPYTAAVNDRVVVLTNSDGNWVVIGALATS
ncbi:hypothetical protein [Streptomyces canus]|uniref:hypothetical protein n=1 Tax=Streptomyces canus TaxID=58343 RepID=UPI00386BBA5D|nr:hypothetical protein OH824_34760 [Streptomyces canus]